MGAVDGVQIANDAELFRMASKMRHEVGELDSWQGRVDRFEFAPHFGFRIRFGVQGVMVTGSATGPDENAIRLGAVVQVRGLGLLTQ